MSWEIEIAREFKKRNNPKLIGATIGKVLSVTPFQASILGGQIILDYENCYICSSLLNRSITTVITGEVTSTGNININDSSSSTYNLTGTSTVNGEVTLSNIFNIGDNVLVIPNHNEQMFFIVDTVKGVS